MSNARRLLLAVLAGVLVLLGLVVVSLGRPAEAAPAAAPRAAVVQSWDCNAYKIQTDIGQGYRYCRESPHGGAYYISVRLFRFYEGAPQYKWKDGTQETPHVGNGSWVGWNEAVWDYIDRTTVEVYTGP